MSSKLFLFTEEELLQINTPKTKAIGISGQTWESAMRYMSTVPFGCLAAKKDGHNKLIGYEVSWLEGEEQTPVLDQLPNDVGKAFQEMRFSEDFINESIAFNRKMIRKHWKELDN